MNTGKKFGNLGILHEKGASDIFSIGGGGAKADDEMITDSDKEETRANLRIHTMGLHNDNDNNNNNNKGMSLQHFNDFENQPRNDDGLSVNDIIKIDENYENRLPPSSTRSAPPTLRPNTMPKTGPTLS